MQLQVKALICNNPVVSLISFHLFAVAYDIGPSIEPISMASKLPPPDESRAPLVNGILWSAFALASVAVILRFWIRLKRQAHGWDDYTIYLAYVSIQPLCPVYSLEGLMMLQVSAVTTAVSGQYVVYNGLGQHMIYVEDSFSQFLQFSAIAQILVTIGVCLVRASVTLLLLRIISMTYPKLRIALWTIFAVDVLYSFIALVLLGTRCIPLKKAWIPSVEGFCFSTDVLTSTTVAQGGEYTIRYFLMI